jgi:5-methylthioadenosine/S-adenosylhomocysteine deaminase
MQDASLTQAQRRDRRGRPSAAVSTRPAIRQYADRKMSERSPARADLIVTARWLVPIEPAGVVLENHGIAVAGGRILAIAPREEILRLGAPLTIDRPEHALLPGLVNAHTHAAMVLMRGLADDLALDDWLGKHIWPAESRWAGAEFVRDGTRLAMLEMIRGGTTCFNDMYFFPDVVASLAVEHQVRACVGMIVIEQPTPWAATTEEYFTKGLAVHDQYRGHPLVRTCFAPHAPYSVSDATLRHVRLLADELEVPIHMHVHETARELEESLREHGERPLARLQRLGLVSSALMAVHATQLAADEIAQLRACNATVVHCPSSNLKLASGLCPVAGLLTAGVNVALGTDGAASNNTLDMFGEMRLAALLAKGVTGDATVLPAELALELATINGARSLGLGDEIGSLVPGKWADMICVDLSEPACQPVHHVVSQLVYAAQRGQVSDVWIAGRQVLADRSATLLDERETVARAAAWRQRLAA